MNDDTDKIWFYRAINVSYGIHTKLYHIEYALNRIERNSITRSGTILVSAFIGFILFFERIFNIKFGSTDYIIIVIFAIALIIVYVYQYWQAFKAEKELKIHIERRPEYLWDQAMAWSARILMAKEVLDENEKITDKQDNSYILTKKNFTRILKYSKERLEKIKKECEASKQMQQCEYKDFKATITSTCDEYDEIGNEYINKGEK